MEPLTFDVHERAELHFARIVILPVHARCTKDEVEQRRIVNSLHFLFRPVVACRRRRCDCGRGRRRMRRERTFQQRERGTRGSSDAQHESRVKGRPE
jgi:hypothetical protein